MTSRIHKAKNWTTANITIDYNFAGGVDALDLNTTTRKAGNFVIWFKIQCTLPKQIWKKVTNDMKQRRVELSFNSHDVGMSYHAAQLRGYLTSRKKKKYLSKFTIYLLEYVSEQAVRGLVFPLFSFEEYHQSIKQNKRRLKRDVVPYFIYLPLLV